VWVDPSDRAKSQVLVDQREMNDGWGGRRIGVLIPAGRAAGAGARRRRRAMTMHTVAIPATKITSSHGPMPDGKGGGVGSQRADPGGHTPPIVVADGRCVPNPDVGGVAAAWAGIVMCGANVTAAMARVPTETVSWKERRMRENHTG